MDLKNKMKKNQFRTYVSSRPFGKLNIPVPLQSLGIRDFCSKNNLAFVLPVNENSFPNSYLVLEGIIENLNFYEGIIMYSINMLPTKKEKRLKLINKILQQNCRVLFVLENISISDDSSLKETEFLIKIKQNTITEEQLQKMIND